MSDQWDVAQYEKFRLERYQPAYDLIDLIDPCPGARIVDLGCGTGEITAELHKRMQAGKTLGLDTSDAMLIKAQTFETEGLSFEKGDISGFGGEWDVVFSNAAFQWVPDHEGLFHQLREHLASGSQLAVQMPSNFDHPSHTVAFELEQESPYREALPGPNGIGVLPVERYAEMLFRLGFKDQTVRENVYLHPMDSKESVIEWVNGTMLRHYRKHLSPELWQAFYNEYSRRLMTRLSDDRPYPYTFKRILLHASRP